MIDSPSWRRRAPRCGRSAGGGRSADPAVTHGVWRQDEPGPVERSRRPVAAATATDARVATDGQPPAAPGAGGRRDGTGGRAATSGGPTDDRGGPVPGRHGGPGSAAAGAQAASFPIHFGRQPTPVALPSAACSPSDCDPWWRPPPTCPTGSGRRVTPSTWWGVRSATPSWPMPATGAARGGPRPRLHHRRPARRHRGGGRAAGPTRCGPRASGSAPSAAGVATRSTRSPPTGPRPTGPTPASPRWPSATGSRTTWPGGTSPSTPWPSGCPSSSSSIPFDGLVDLVAHRLRTPLDPEVSFADDPLRMLRAARFIAKLELEPDPGAGGGRRGRPPPAVHRLGRADPGRAGQDRDGAGALGGPVVRGADRTGRRVPARAPGSGPRAGPDPPAQGRPGPHPGGGGQDRPRPAAAPGRALPRRGQAEDPGLRRRRRDLPPPRGGGGPHDPPAHAGPAVSERRGGGGDRAGQPPPPLPHLPAGMDRPSRAPLRPGRRARCSTGSTS